MSGDLHLSAESWANITPGVISFFSWTTLYFTLCILNSKKSYEYHVRLVTTCHAVLVCTMAGWSGFVLGPWPFTDPGGPMTRMEYITCNVCLGYFLFDFLWCLYFQTEGAVMLLHHALSILGNTLIIYLNVSGTEMMAAIFGSELTNPFLQLRWFLREAGNHKTWYGELNDAVFMLLFFCLRIVVGSNLLYWFLLHPRPRRLVKLGGLMHYLVGWAFFFMIARYALRKYKKLYLTKSKVMDTINYENIELRHSISHQSNGNHQPNRPLASISDSNGLLQRKNTEK